MTHAMNEGTNEVIEQLSNELRLRLESEGVLIMVVGTDIHCVFNCKNRDTIPHVVRALRDAANRIAKVNEDLF